MTNFSFSDWFNFLAKSQILCWNVLLDRFLDSILKRKFQRRIWLYSGIDQPKNGHVTDLIGWFQCRVKFYAGVLFIGSSPGLVWTDVLHRFYKTSPRYVCLHSSCWDIRPSVSPYRKTHLFDNLNLPPFLKGPRSQVWSHFGILQTNELGTD